jgi:transmembrane sensor
MMHASENIGEKLILRYLLGEATPEEQANIEQWLEDSDGNRKLLDQYEMLWAEAGRLTPHPIAVDLNTSWNRLNKRINTYEKEQTKHLSGKSIKWLLPVIAAAVLLFLIPKWFATSPKVPTLSFTSHRAVVKDTLPDGTIIVLNTKSTIQSPKVFATRERRISLRGEAFIKAAPDKNKPLIIETGPAWVTVVGTEFNLKARPGKDVEVYVKEGLVQLACKNKASGEILLIALFPGETGKWDRETNQLKKTKIPNPDVMAWHENTFIFRNTDLEKVFSLLESHFGVKIIFNRHQIKNCRLSTTFANQDIDEIIKIISTTFELQYSKDGKTYKITGNGCD